MNQYLEAHKVLLEGSRQASILVMAMIASQGIWKEQGHSGSLSSFFLFSFISVVSCVATHLIYGIEYAFLVRNLNRPIKGTKTILFLSSITLGIQILTLLVSLVLFMLFRY